MNVVFRVDASPLMGLGHVMRCLALAQALAALGARATFLARQIPDSTAQRIQSLGFGVHRLPERPALPGLEGYDAWLGVSWQDDAQDTRDALAALGGVDWLVVDHYAIDQRWQGAVRDAARHLAVIDDLDNRPHDCDLLIDHNPSLVSVGRYAEHVPAGALRLLGPRYALLRPEFSSARGEAPPVRRSLKRIVIATGGADPDGVAGHVIAALVPLAFEGFALDVVVGAAAARRDAIAKAVAAIPGATLHVDVPDMTPIYLNADLAVGAAGVGAWERCTLGLPCLILTLADNQQAGAQALAELGGGIHFGRATAQHLVALAGVARALAQSPDWLALMSRRAAAVCDGHGAARVAARMESFDMRLRKVEAADSERLWQWRNDEINRRFALDPRPIAQESHQRWFAARIDDPDCLLAIAEDEVGPVGVLRYEINGSRATVSIYLVPGRHGQGRGGVLLLAGEAWLREQRPDVSEIEAEILAENRASLNVFAESGYREHSEVVRKRL